MVFDREKELDLLRSRFMQAPEGILVILGPHSCGKSAVLSHCFSKQAQKDGLGAFGSYMDGRGAALTDSAVFARILADQQAGWMDWAKKAGDKVHDTINPAQVTLKHVKFGVGPLFAAFAEQRKDPELKLQDVLETYLEMLERYSTMREKGSYPVICLDEANILKAWQSNPKRREDLDTLMRFLVKVSKQDKLAHVVLASSDSGFLAWIQDVAPAASVEVQVIGNFEEHLARDFFENSVLATSSSLPEADWKKVHKNAGGNAGILRQLGKYGSDLDQGISHLRGQRADLMRKGFAGAADFTSKQYAQVCLQIANGRNISPRGISNSLNFRSAEDQYGSKAICSMIKENLLYYRPFSAWSKDIDSTAFGMNKEAILTFPDDVFLETAKAYRDDGVLEHYIQKVAAVQQVAVVPQVSSEIVTVQKELDKLDKDIEAIVDKITGFDKEMKQLKKDTPANWVSDLADLRDDKGAARRTEEQLRRKEEQLRREKEQLNDRYNILLGRS